MDERTADHIERSERRYWGKYRGIVRDRDDPHQLGRLRIEVPSLLGTTSTGWAWPAVSFAGNNTGMVFIPAVGDLVWVEFVEGELDEPVWTAGAWARPGGTSQLPDEARDGYPDRSVIRTTAGHVIELSDVPGKERVVIRAKGGASIVLDDSGKVTVTANEIVLASAQPQPPAPEELATKSFVELVFKNHTHPSGVGPTGQPLPGPPVAHTLTTVIKAE